MEFAGGGNFGFGVGLGFVADDYPRLEFAFSFWFDLGRVGGGVFKGGMGGGIGGRTGGFGIFLGFVVFNTRKRNGDGRCKNGWSDGYFFGV